MSKRLDLFVSPLMVQMFSGQWLRHVGTTLSITRTEFELKDHNGSFAESFPLMSNHIQFILPPIFVSFFQKVTPDLGPIIKQ